MSHRLLIPLPDGQWLALSPEVFAQALADARSILPGKPDPRPIEAGGAPELFTAQQMQARTGVPASWFLKKAREREIPHQQLGRYVRFDLAALAAANLLPPVSRVTNGYDHRRSG